MYKRGAYDLPENERRKLKGDWYFKLRLGDRSYKPLRLCADHAVSELWAKAIESAYLKRQADEAIDWDRLKQLGIPQRLLEQAGLVSKRAESRKKAWAAHVDDYVTELTRAGRSSVYVNNARRYLTMIGAKCRWIKITDANRDQFAAFLA